ncbi:MAG: hypothetical protein FJW31_29130 [Acidobacteria bacterium]|nr:hypothetical protein [Acidobacteriota bacterium]
MGVIGLAALALAAQQAAVELPSGPAVGARVPDFTLTDQAGRPRTLASLMGKRGLMLSFVRSADW